MHSHTFRACPVLTHWHTHALTSIQGCSIITQRCSHALTSVQGVFSSDTNEIFLIVTPWWVAFNNDSMAFMRTQWAFTLTEWHSCAFNGCSGAVPTHSLAFMHTQWVFRGCSHSLIGIHTHSQAFRRCSIHVKSVHVPEGPMNMISNLQMGPLNLLSISIECHFFGFAKQEDMMSHLNTWLVGGLGVRQWDW